MAVLIGKIVHYFDKIQVAVVKADSQGLKIGDSIRIGDENEGLDLTVESLQVDHNNVGEIRPGDEAGMKVPSQVKKGDPVYKL